MKLKSFKQFLNEFEIENTKVNVIVYGESHFHRDEVDRIRKQIIRNKPNILLFELPEDYKFYKKYLPNTKLHSLEKGLDVEIYNLFKDNLTEQFKYRESNMLSNIENAISAELPNNGHINVNVVVGDTHLRTIKTTELGDKSPFYNMGYNIIRSHYKEIE